MLFTVLRSKAVSRFICDKQRQPSLVNYMPTTRQREIQVQGFGRQFNTFSDFLRAQNMVRVIEDKII